MVSNSYQLSFSVCHGNQVVTATAQSRHKDAKLSLLHSFQKTQLWSTSPPDPRFQTSKTASLKGSSTVLRCPESPRRVSSSTLCLRPSALNFCPFEQSVVSFFRWQSRTVGASPLRRASASLAFSAASRASAAITEPEIIVAQLPTASVQAPATSGSTSFVCFLDEPVERKAPTLQCWHFSCPVLCLLWSEARRLGQMLLGSLGFDTRPLNPDYQLREMARTVQVCDSSPMF